MAASVTEPAIDAPLWGTRAVLPQRRPHVVVPFEFDGQRFVGGIGTVSAGDRTVREIWINTHKRHSTLDAMVSGYAVAVSIALQHGATVAGIAAGLMRNTDGSPLCPVGAFLDIIAREEW
jgi:hypothetical protein